jgi:cytoskeleton protein RodZ
MVGLPKTGKLQGYDSFEVRLGDELRGERATLGKSLLDVQRDLRIKAAYIAAIENCDTSVFQNKGFVAGYVRSYARYLNLDAEAVFARFSAEAGFGGVNEGMNPKAKKVGGSIPPRNKVAQTNSLVHPALRSTAIRPSMFSGVSTAGIGSIVVLVALVGGLGLGAWSILQDIQRVQLVPVDQTPGASATVATMDAPEVAEGPEQTAAPAVTGPSDLLYARVYRPQELELPVIDHRDGPIANIDPDLVGLGPTEAAGGPSDIANMVEMVVAEGDTLRDPQLVESTGPKLVSVFATSPAWIRVYLADGSRVFEKILETGETYVLPADVQAPLLRAGNSGSVYLSVDNVAYGPIGSGTAIAKDVSLILADVQANWPLAPTQPEQTLLAVTPVAANVSP